MNKEQWELKDNSAEPTDDVIKQALGNLYDVYLDFLELINRIEVEQNWQWYKPYKAWLAKGQYWYLNSRGIKKEKNLYWLHVYKGYFYVVVWFLEKDREQVLKVCKSEEIKNTVMNSAILGKMKTFPVMIKVADNKFLLDIHLLIELRKDLN